METASTKSFAADSEHSDEQLLPTTPADTLTLKKHRFQSAFFSFFRRLFAIGRKKEYQRNRIGSSRPKGNGNKNLLRLDVLEANSTTFAFTAKKTSPIGYKSPGGLFHSLLSVPISGSSCPLCRQRFCDKNILRCLHCLDVFHQSCIDQALLKKKKKKVKCPKCRRKDIFPR